MPSSPSQRWTMWTVPGFISTILFCQVVLCCEVGRGGNWTQFRGENGSGVSDELAPAPHWGAEQIRWKVNLPGVGHSAPVIWGSKLYLTSASDQGKARLLVCLNAETGEQLWIRSFPFASNPKHNKSSWASSTPAVDRERVYVVFADVEHQVLITHGLDGKELWRQDLGSFASQHGQGASPILYEDLVILANDQDGPSSITAWDKRTGKQAWSVARNFGAQSTSYATPLIYHPKEGPPQLICSSSKSGISALDPHSGKTIWTTGSLPQRTVASPVISEGLIFQCCGAGGQGMLMVAVDPSGHGDVSTSHVRYERKKILPYVPTPLAYGNYLFLWGDHGIVCCMDPLTGKDVWTRRIGGEFSGSPICAGGTLFNIDERGTVIAISAGSEFKSVGEIPLGDSSNSTPAVANGRIYFRTFHHLVCASARP